MVNFSLKVEMSVKHPKKMSAKHEAKEQKIGYDGHFLKIKAGAIG